jgi:hypothetical protein
MELNNLLYRKQVALVKKFLASNGHSLVKDDENSNRSRHFLAQG